MTDPVRQLTLAAVGDPLQTLELTTLADLKPGSGQVLVDIAAAAINPSDVLYASGQYLKRPQTPTGMGAEGAGTVVAVGPEVSADLLGRTVVLLPTYRHGTWASSVLADVTDIVVAPDGIDVQQLAMIGINAMTAYQLLSGYGHPGAAERWIGMNAGNSAVGEYLVKLARHFGHHTVAVVRRESAVQTVRSWGADHVIVDSPDLNDDLSARLGAARFDIAVDSLGGPTSTALAHHLEYGGTLVSYGTQTGRPPAIATADLIGRHTQLTGFWLLNWLEHNGRATVADAYGTVIDLLAQGVITAQVEAALPLEEWRTALTRATAPGRHGKILFIPSHQPVPLA